MHEQQRVEVVFDRHEPVNPDCEEAEAEIKQLRAELGRLRAALVKYGAHTDINCRPENTPSGYLCACGLYDLIDAEAHLAGLD